MVEGLSTFGSLSRTVLAGMGAGAVLPGLFTVVSIVYGWVNNWFAPAGSRASYGPGRLWEFVVLYGMRFVAATLLLAALGGLFSLARRMLARWRIRLERSPNPWLIYLCDSRLFAAGMGWSLYVVWALWPRGEGMENLSGALEHPWIWLFFGVLWSAYFHWGHHAFLYRLYYRDWEAGCRAVVVYLIEALLKISPPAIIEADVRTGHVTVRNLPKGAGRVRLLDLVQRIPGVHRVDIEEVGSVNRPGWEVMTLHVPDTERERLPLITCARGVFALCALSGVFIYVFGLSYALTQGKFMLWSNFIVVLAIQVEAIGLILAFSARHLLVRRAQKDLPNQLERVLYFIGKEMKHFAFGRTWEEARVTADLSRREASEHLLPVAARFGLKRLLVETPLVRR